MGTPTPHPNSADRLVEKLVALARNAHTNVDTHDPFDYWYRLGQRNAYTHATGLAVGAGVDQAAFEVADRLNAALTAGQTDLHHLVTAARATTPAPEVDGMVWVEPKTFAARYGHLPGIDHDYGMPWGAKGEQRISLRRTPDADHGLLYAYDPTWDEYALLNAEAPVAAVQAAYQQALESDIHMSVAAFTEVVRSHQILLETVVRPAQISMGIEP